MSRCISTPGSHKVWVPVLGSVLRLNIIILNIIISLLLNIDIIIFNIIIFFPLDLSILNIINLHHLPQQHQHYHPFHHPSQHPPPPPQHHHPPLHLPHYHLHPCPPQHHHPQPSSSSTSSSCTSASSTSSPSPTSHHRPQNHRRGRRRHRHHHHHQQQQHQHHQHYHALSTHSPTLFRDVWGLLFFFVCVFYRFYRGCWKNRWVWCYGTRSACALAHCMLRYLKFMCSGTLDGMVVEVPLRWHVIILVAAMLAGQ